MLTILTAIAIASGFFLLYPILRGALQRAVGPLNASPVVPVILTATHAFMPLIFVVERADGTELLDAGLTSSNKVMMAITGATALYVAWKMAGDRRVWRLPFAMPYLPFTIMIGFDLASAAWSLVPAYTFYRAGELAVLFLASILIFDRTTIERFLPGFLMVFTGIWLAATAPTWLESIAHGTVFSAAKHNLMPMVSIALLAHAMFLARGPRARLAEGAVAAIGFIIAGSAASTAALIGFVPAILIASRSPPVRILGALTMALCIVGFFVLMLGFSAFPGLLHFVSTVLQKPPEELTNATGRVEFWPAIIEGTRDRLFGSGFSAADRFLQLLVSASELRARVGETELNLSSAHNMFLSAWAGTGLLGLTMAVTVLAVALRWGFRLTGGGRRFVIAFVFSLILNGMTTPGIFQDWNVNVLAFVGVLAYARIRAGERPHTVRRATAGEPPDLRFAGGLSPQGGMPG